MVADSATDRKSQWVTLDQRQRAALLGLSVTLLGACLRVLRISANGYSLDETWSIWMARHDAARIVQLIMVEGGDATPPTFYLLLRMLVQFGEHPIFVRGVSVLAGSLTVLLTFIMARKLFDTHVATLSGLFVAMAPLHITYSQVARAYVLSALWALASLYFFSRILFERERWGLWLGFVATSALALWTFYLTFLIIAYENAYILVRWLRKKATPSTILRWILSQVVLAALCVPVLLMMLSKTQSTGQSWLTKPGLGAIAKGLILYTTGDPSYGPTGLTLARVASLALVAAVALLGLWLLFRPPQSEHSAGDLERVTFVAGAFLAPWILALAISQVRVIYKEKYLLYVMPPLLIVGAWVLSRSRPRILARLLLLALVGIMLSALFVFYTEPFGEQWREAVAYIQNSPTSEAPVVLAPGYYYRPFLYYYNSSTFPDLGNINTVPAVFIEHGECHILEFSSVSPSTDAMKSRLASGNDIWLVSGYAPVDPQVTEFIRHRFEPVRTVDLVGVQLQLLKTANDTTSGLFRRVAHER